MLIVRLIASVSEREVEVEEERVVAYRVGESIDESMLY